jgi:DNA-binding YbaB/EbfC family protein
MNIQKMMKQAQEMQARLADAQAKVEAQEMDGSAAGGLVRVRMNGKHQLISVAIDANLLKPEEKEVLEDLVIAAHNDAKAKLDDNASAQMSQVTSGLNLPPGMKLPF